MEHYLLNDRVKKAFGVWQAARKDKHANKESLLKLEKQYRNVLNNAKLEWAKEKALNDTNLHYPKQNVDYMFFGKIYLNGIYSHEASQYYNDKVKHYHNG